MAGEPVRPPRSAGGITASATPRTKFVETPAH